MRLHDLLRWARRLAVALGVMGAVARVRSATLGADDEPVVAHLDPETARVANAPTTTGRRRDTVSPDRGRTDVLAHPDLRPSSTGAARRPRGTAPGGTAGSDGSRRPRVALLTGAAPRHGDGRERRSRRTAPRSTDVPLRPTAIAATSLTGVLLVAVTFVAFAPQDGADVDTAAADVTAGAGDDVLDDADPPTPGDAALLLAPGPSPAAASVAIPRGALAPAPCAPRTLEALASSVLMVGMPDVVDADDPLVDELVALGVGGVLLNGSNVVSEEQLRALTAGLADRFDGNVAIALDEEGGRVSPLARIDLGGPSARRLAARDGDDIEEAGREAGSIATELGVTVLLGPVADLDDGPAGGIIGDRSFGTDPDLVGEAARRYARGVHSGGASSVVKHWPGYAGAPDTHLGGGTAPVDRRELLGVHVAAFLPVLDDGIEGVMVSHVVYPPLGPLPASLNPAAYRLLRDRGYDGPVVTDALGMGAIHTRWGFDRSGALAIAAGADVALSNQGAEARILRDGIVAAVTSGELDGARLREAATRAATLRPGC